MAIRSEVAEGLVTQITTSTITDDANKLVPSGAIILWTGGSCPAGYTRVSALDNKFLVGGATFNAAAGGADTKDISHNHGGSSGSHTLVVGEIPGHTHLVVGRRIRKSGGDSEVAVLENTGDLDRGAYSEETNSTGGGGGHSHSISMGGSAALDIRPQFATILLCEKD